MYMLLVPCSQAVLIQAFRQNKALNVPRIPLAELWRYPLNTREVGMSRPNMLSSLYFESQAYQVTISELLGWEHSKKNELIMANS
jgi:hypothetical protein